MKEKYVVTGCENGNSESEVIIGVYPTREKAREAASEVLNNFKNEEAYVTIQGCE